MRASWCSWSSSQIVFYSSFSIFMPFCVASHCTQQLTTKHGTKKAILWQRRYSRNRVTLWCLLQQTTESVDLLFASADISYLLSLRLSSLLQMWCRSRDRHRYAKMRCEIWLHRARVVGASEMDVENICICSIFFLMYSGLFSRTLEARTWWTRFLLASLTEKCFYLAD